MKKIIAGLMLAAFAASSVHAAMPPAPVYSDQKDQDGKALPFGRLPWKPNDTPMGTGPYKAVMFTDPTLPGHVLYAPADLAKAGRLPVVTWGNGACINAGNRFRAFLEEISSHGYFILATGVMGDKLMETGAQENPHVPSPDDPPPRPRDPNAPPPPPPTTAAQMTQALDWAFAENERQGGKWYHRLDLTKVAVMGQSCGGSQALSIAADPRITVLGIFSSGVGMGGNPPGSALATIHTPILYMHGDKVHDVAFPSAHANFEGLNTVPVVEAWQEGLWHIGTYGQPNGGANAVVATAWLQWRLKGDQQGAKMFRGKDCGLYVSPGWHVATKHID